MSVTANRKRNVVASCDKQSYPVAQSNVVTVEGAQLHFVVQGSGRPVVLIHGNPGSFQDWLNLFDSLAARFGAYAFDRPGHGKSERPRMNGEVTPETQARLLNHALHQLNVERPILVGHSWGGSLALIYALLYPEQVAGLVLLAPAAYAFDDGLSILHKIPSWPVMGDFINRLLTPWLSPRLVRTSLEQAFSPQEVPAAYLQHALTEWTRPGKVKWYSVDEALLNAALEKFGPRYSELTLPVAVLTGDSDLIVPARENAIPLTEALPQASLLLLENTGHQISLVHPDVVLHAIQLIAELT